MNTSGCSLETCRPMWLVSAMYCQTRDIENELFFFFPINHFGGVKYTNSITFNLIYIYNRYIYIHLLYIYIYYIYISIIYISIIYIHIHICIMYNLYITPTLVVSSHIFWKPIRWSQRPFGSHESGNQRRPRMPWRRGCPGDVLRSFLHNSWMVFF
jgi:hypothetical protein